MNIKKSDYKKILPLPELSLRLRLFSENHDKFLSMKADPFFATAHIFHKIISKVKNYLHHYKYHFLMSFRFLCVED